jgi:hypothetical protein
MFMKSEQPQGPICQSCGMPIGQTDLQGTEVDKSKSKKYCVYCYQGGTFLQPDATLGQMIEISAKGWSDQDPAVSYDQAKAQMEAVLPHLERWRQ